MATPMTPATFLSALRAEGLTVVEVGAWRTHNRNHKGAWGPVHGIMHHHTVSYGNTPDQTASSVALCRFGYAELPGPLCHGVIAKDGTVYLVGYGRANHAGGGDPNVLQAVKDERYGDRPPVPRVANAAGVDGNPHFYGFESINLGNGKDPWPAKQVDAMVRVSAAISRVHGWQHQSSIAHREWKNDKPDPAGPGMPAMPEFRARIKERLEHAPGWNPQAPSKPPTTGTPAMTVPARLLLQRTENVTLLQDVPHTIYWPTEYPDDANQHGDGGKTVGTNIRYSGIVNVRLSGLVQNEVVEVYAAEEDANGVLIGESEIRSQVPGRNEGFHPVTMSVALVGSASGRLVIRVVSRQGAPVTLEEAWLSFQSWPLNA